MSSSRSRGKMPAQVPRVGKLTTVEKVIQKYGRPMILYEIAFEITEAIQKSFSPYLRDEKCHVQRMSKDLRKNYGDYICKSILSICEILRANDPTLFDKTKPTDIAKAIIDNFPKSDMLEDLKIVDIGFITFKLNGHWMANRIRNHLKEGVDAWAPLLFSKRAIVGSPVLGTSDAKKIAANGVRLEYIRDTLVRLLEYCRVEVSGTVRTKQALQNVKKYFSEENGTIRIKGKKGKKGKKGEHDPLFIIKEEAPLKGQPNNVYEDLAALWCGFYEQKADWIVYVTPVRQRDYIRKCFDATKEFKYADPAIMIYLGVKDFGAEQNNLANLSKTYDFYKGTTFGENYGYSVEALFDCTIRYEYLKKVTYSDCTFEKPDEMLRHEGNTFMNILATKALIGKVLLKHSSPDLESKEALVGRERDLGLELLQFTEVIQESIQVLTPNWLCEYLYNLSVKLSTYMVEHVEQLSETGVLLLKAAEVVMEQSFHLLGLTPGCSTGEQSYWKEQSGEHMAIRDLYISYPVSRLRFTSRFEIFTMYIEVNHPNFKNGCLFGNISVSDTFGLRSDKWCNVRNGCGHVAYFKCDWHDSIGIKDSSFLSLGDPASRHSVAFSSSVEIGVCLWATSKNDEDNDKEACYQLCDAKREIELQGFWRDDGRTLERSAFEAVGDNGYVSMYYFLLKDAVDTCISLEYKPIDCDLQVRGYVLAYYGGDVLSDCVNDFEKKSYKAEVFRTQSTRLLGGDLTLKKSALAVPTNGILVFEAYFEDADSREIIVNDTHDFHEEHEGHNSEWIIKRERCCFTLKVDWIRD